MIFSALFAKLLSAGAVAQAATGATVAVVAFTGVGAVGALPDPVQDTFATVVAAVSPLEAPTSGESTEEVVTVEETTEELGTTDSDVIEDDVEVDVQAWIDAGPAEGETFSAWVLRSKDDAELRALMLDEGFNFGQVVSAVANQKGIDKKELLAQGVDLDALTEDDATETESDLSDDTAETATESWKTEKTEKTRAGTTVEDRGSRGNGWGDSRGDSRGDGPGDSRGDGRGDGRN